MRFGIAYRLRSRSIQGAEKRQRWHFSHELDWKTYRATIQHAAGNGDSGRELETLPLQRPVHLPDVSKFVAAFGSRGPGLDELEDLGAHFGVDGAGADCFEKGHQTLHELSGCDLGEEVGAAILDAGVGELVKLATKSSPPGSRGKARG